MNGSMIMSYSIYICSGLAVIGIFSIFISVSFTNVASYRRDQRLGFFHSLFIGSLSNLEKKIRKKLLFFFFIGLSLLFIGVFAGIFLQRVS